MDPLDPSPPSPFARAGRTIWSVWYYVAEAVGRFLRPEVIDNDGQEPEESNAEINVRVEGAEETQTDPTTSSVENRPQSTVTWEECDSNNGVGPAKENVQYTVQFTRGSDGHTLENYEGEIEEQIADTGPHVAKEMATEEEEVENDGKQHLIVKVTSTLKTDENEELDYFGSSNLTHVTLSDNMEETNRNSGLEEIGGIMAHEERQNVDETLRNVQVKDWNEGEEVLIEDEPQDLKDACTARCSGSEDYAGQLCTSVSPEKDSSIYREDLALARQEEGRGMEHEADMRKETERHTSVSEQASALSDSEDENDLTSDEGSAEHGGAGVEEAVLLCEEILHENSDVTASEVAQDAQLQTTGAVENKNTELSGKSEHIDHLTVTDGKAQLTGINIPVDEEKTSPDEGKVSSSEADMVNKKETAPIEVKIESNNGGEITGNLTHVTLSDDMEETKRNSGLEEEIGEIMAHDEREKVDETFRNVQVKDGNEGEEVLTEDEAQSLKDACTVRRSGSEDNSGQLCTSVSQDNSIYREDVALVRQEEEKGNRMEHEAVVRKETERHTSVSEQASTLSDSEDENDLTSHEGLVEHGGADVQEAMLLCEEICDENTDVTTSEVAQDAQLKITYNKRTASDHDITVAAQVMGETLLKNENDANDPEVTEDGSIAVEREKDVEIKAQIDDKGKEITKSNILDCGFEAEDNAEEYIGTKHIQVSEPITENMEIQLNRAQYEGGNQDCIAAENVAVENQSMEPSVMSEPIDHLTVTDGKAQLTEINSPVDEEKPRPDEDKVSSSEEDIVHTKESAFTPIAVKNESNNGGEGTENLTHVMLSENMEETNRNIGLEEEIGTMMAHDERQNVDIQVKDGNEGEEVLFEDETQRLKDVCTVLHSESEENSGQLYMSVSPEKDGNIYREEVALLTQEEEEGTGMEHEAAMRKDTERCTSVSEQASTLSDSDNENDLTCDEGLVEHGRADVQETMLLCEEILDENSDITASEATQDTQLQMTYNKRAAASGHDITVCVQVQMMGERLPKTENNDANGLNATEDGSIAVEREQEVEIKAQIDDKEKEMTKSNILEFGFEAEVIAEDDMDTEHIQVSEPITENMEIQLKAQYEGGNQDCIAALLGTVTQTTENVAVENQSMEPSVMSEHIDHLTVTDGKAQLTEISSPVDEEKPRPDEDKVSSSEEDIVHTQESAVTPIAVKNESNNGGEGTGHFTHVTLSDNMEETNRNSGLEEEIGAIMAHDERQNVDVQVKDGNEGEEVLFEDETQSLKDVCSVLRSGSEENSGQLYMSVSPEKDGNIYREDVALLRQEEEEGTGMEHEAAMRKDTERHTSVSEQASTLSDSDNENDLTSDEELVEHGGADVQETMLLREEILDENSDVTASEAAQDTQLQMTYNKRAAASDYDLTVSVQAQMMGERLPKTENNDANDLNATEGGSIAVEREQEVEIKAQIDDKEKEITKSNILDFGFEAEVIAEDDMGTEHIQVSGPITENMEIQLNRAQYEGGNQDCIAALLETITQTTENVAVENQSMEPSVMSEHIDHLTVTDGKAQLTEINIQVDEEKTRPDEDKVSSSEEDIVHTKESAFTPIAVKNESNNGAEGTGNLTHVTLSDNVEETNRNIGLEEEIGTMMAHDERKNVDVQVKDGNEGEEVLFEEETQSLKDVCTVLHSESEENSGQLYMSVSPEKDSNIYREEVALLTQEEEEGTGMEHEAAMRKDTERCTSVSEQASTLSDSDNENDLTSDEELVEHGGADVQETMLLREEIFDENGDVTASEAAQDIQLQMTYNKRENNGANDLDATEDGSIAVEREQEVEIKAQIDDKEKEITKSNILDFGFEAEVIAEDDMGTEHIQVSEPITENMEIQLNRAQYEGGNQDCIAALLGTVTQTTENVAVENQSMEPSVMSEHIDHLTVTDGKAQLTEINIPVDEEKTRPDEEKVSSSEEDIAQEAESHNGGEGTGHFTHVTLSDNMEETNRNIGLEEEIGTMMAHDERQNVDIQVKDGNEGEEVLFEEETQSLKDTCSVLRSGSEENSGQLYMSVSPEKDGNIYREDVALLRQEEEKGTGMEHETDMRKETERHTSVSEQASTLSDTEDENDLTSDEGLVEHGGADVQEAMLLCEEILDENSDVTASEAAQDIQLQMTYNKRENNDANDLNATEDGSIAVEREQEVEIKAQIDDKEKEMTNSNILDFGFEAEVIAEDDMGTEHIQVSEPITYNMEIQLNRAQYEGGNQDCIAALLGTITQTTENVAVENQSMEPSVMSEHIDHLTVTGGKAQLTEINIPVDEEKPRPDEDKVSSSEEDIAQEAESHNGGEGTGHFTHVTLSDNMEETNRNIGLEEEIGTMMAHDERQNVDVQVKDGNEGEEVLFEEETQRLKDTCTVLRSGSEENSGQLYMSVSPEKDGNIYREDVALLRQEEEKGTGMEHETDMRKETERGTSVSEQASTLSDTEDENDLTSDEGLVEHGGADVQEAMLLCEEILDENSDVTASEAAQDIQLQMTYNKRENNDANDLNATEDGSIAVEREQEVEIKAQIDDKEKEMTNSNILDFGFEAEVIAEDDMGTEHIQVSEPITENMEIQLNRAQYEGGNQDCIAALLETVTQTTENVAVENQSMEPSVMSEHIDHLTVTGGKAQLTEINIPVDEEKPRPDEDKVSSSDEDIVHTKESAFTPIAVKIESNNGGEGTGNLTHVTLSDNMEETNRNIGLEEEIGTMMAHDERQNVDVQVKDGNEGEEVLFEYETQSLKDVCSVLRSGSEENSGQLYMSVSPENDGNIYKEDMALLRQEEEEGRGMEHEAAMRKETERHTSVSEQASTLSDSEDENDLTSDEGLVEHGGRDAQEAMLLCQEILDENSNVTASEAAQDAELQMTYNKRENNDANDLNATEDGSIAVEREQEVEIKAQIDDKEKEITKSNILDFGFEAEVIAEDDMGTEHIQVSEPITENMEIQLNRAQYEGGNQDCIAALLGTITQTTENVAVENQSMEPSVMTEHIDHLTVTDGKAQLTEINSPVDEEKPRPDEDKVSSSEEDIVHKKESAVTPIAVKNESNNGGETTGNLTHVTLSDNMEETNRNIGLEEEIGAMMAHDERQNVDVQVKDGNEGEEVLFEDETQSLKDVCSVLRSGSEENSGQLYMSVSPEKDGNIYREDVALLRQEEEEGTGMEHETAMRKETERHTSVSEQASTLSDTEDENDLTSDEGLVEHGGADVQEAMLLCKEICDENSDVTASDVAQDAELQMTYNKRAAASGHDITVIGAQVMDETLLKTENKDANDLNATEDGSIAVEREQSVEIDSQIDDKGKEITKGIILDCRFDAESGTEDDMRTEHIQVSEPMTENMETQLNRAQYEGGNQDAVAALLQGTVTQTTVAVENQSTELSGIGYLTVTDGKAHLTDLHFPGDEEKTRPEENDSEEDIINKNESALTPIAVKTESNNGGEIMGVLRSTSPEISDRLVVVPLKLNSVVCEETQEGVPQYDNNRHELYEDTTQRILEVGDYEEIQSTQLPEEVGSKDLESFIKTFGSGEAGHSFIHGEEQGSKLENALQIENMFDMVAEGHTETLCLTDTELPREKEEPSTEPMDETPAQVSLYISTAEFGPVDASLTTGARHSEHVFETDASSQDETRGTDAEPSAQTAELLAEMNNEPDLKNGPVMDTQNNTTIEVNVDDLSAETMEFPEAELNKVKVTGFVYEPIDPTVLEENISQTISLAESIVETRMMEQPSATWPILNEEKEVQFMAMDVQDAGLNMQEIAGPGIKKTTAEKENSSEIINLQKIETTATSKTTDGEENALFETDIDINTEQLLESIEINHEMFNKQHCTRMEKAVAVGFYNESLDIKSEPELITSKETEITRHGKADKVTELVGGDVRGMGGPHETDDEILDMWIETVLCKDTDNTEPQIIRKPTKREPEETEDEETGSGPDEEMSKLTEKEPQRVSINNEEPETELALGGETEILETSPLVLSGYTAVGQFPCEGASAENETAILKLSGAEVFQAIHETADSMSEFAISALSVKSSEIEDGDMKGADETQDSCIQEDPSTHAIHMHTGFLNNTYDATTVLSEAREDELSYQSQENKETDIVELMGTETGLQVIDPEISDSDLQEKTNWEISKGMEEKSQTCALFQGEAVNTEDKLFGAIALNITDKMKEVNSGKTYKSQEAESEVLGQRSEPLVVLEGRILTESDLHKKTCLEGQDQLCDVLEALSGRKAASSPVELSTTDDAEELATPLPTPGDQLEFNMLDFTPQKTRIAIKNPYVRPPKDPRALLQMPSVEPTPPKPSGRLPMKGLTAVSMGGLGIGIKLPGFGAGFPVLKKTNVSREDNRTEDCPQKETETKPEVNDGSPEPVVVLEGRFSRESDLHKKTCLEGQDQLCDVLDKALSGRKAASSPVELSTAVDAEELATPLPTPGDQPEFNTLDFTPQKTRIAIKNPHVRPPKDPCALLQMPSVEPTPPKPSGRLPMKGLTAVSMGGLGIGIKLPGFGAGFPVLKKTNVSREENLTEDCSQKETETKPEVNDGSPEPLVVLEGRISRESDLHKKTCLEGQDQLCDVLDKAHSGRKAASSPVELSTADDAEELATPLPTPGDQLEFNTLDFTPQKTRIAIKNPHVRPPKDPRALLQMPSAEPTPSKPSGRLPMKRLAGVPMAGLGIGIKLPGFGAGFPVLKKTNVSREENLTEDRPQKVTETKLEVNDGSPRQDVAEHKPKWMPPRQPGFGNPLMSELKNKLKKTSKE